MMLISFNPPDTPRPSSFAKATEDKPGTPLHRGDSRCVAWVPSIKRGGAQRRGV